jgi:Domain of unknown function (DUF1844)
MFIDQLEMIQEKTRGNLTNEETKVLSNALSNLQMAYVEVARETPQGVAKPEAPEAAPSPKPEQPPAGKAESSAPIASTEPGTESRKKFTKSYGP